MLRRLLLGASGGLVGGAVTGAAEALFVLGAGGQAGEYVALFYALLLYGGFGAIVGLGAGALASAVGAALGRPMERGAWVLGALLAVCGLGWRLSRGLALRASDPAAGLSSAAEGWILGGVALLGLAGLWLGPLFLERTPLKILLRLRGIAALYLGLLGFSAIFAFAPTRESPDGTMTPARAPREEGPNVLLILVDGLRADHLGSYGYRAADGEPISPHLDALAEDGVRFSRVSAASSWTRPSAGSLLASLPPSGHGIERRTSALPEEAETLAEVMAAAGYVTGGLPASLDIASSFGFRQGFDYYAFMAPGAPWGATETVNRLAIFGALRRLTERWTGQRRVEAHYLPAGQVLNRGQEFIATQRGRRWFLFAHLMETHAPWFAEDGRESYGYEALDPARIATYRSAYAAEVRRVDAEIGATIDWLKDQGLYDDALIVVTSDHGEEFLEHGGWGHGQTLYEEILSVPLIVKLPRGGRAGSVIDWQVRSIDVAPTIAGLAGVEPARSWWGSDLFEMSGGPIEDRPAFAESGAGDAAITSLQVGAWKLIRASQPSLRGLAPLALYNTAQDPQESRELSQIAGQDLARLDAMLMEHSREAVGASLGAGDGALRLESLGFTE